MPDDRIRRLDTHPPPLTEVLQQVFVYIVKLVDDTFVRPHVSNLK